MVRMLRGIRKYSTVRASANEFGGTMQTSDLMSTKARGSKFFGSMTVLLTFVKTLNSSATRMSYPYDETPYETTPARTWLSSNGSIMPFSRAMRRIHRSDLIGIGSRGLSPASLARPARAHPLIAGTAWQGATGSGSQGYW